VLCSKAGNYKADEPVIKRWTSNYHFLHYLLIVKIVRSKN